MKRSTKQHSRAGWQEPQKGRVRVRFGIKKLLMGILIPLVLVLTVVGLSVNKDVDRIVIELNDDYLAAETVAAANQLDIYFQKYMGTVNTVAQTDVMAQKILGWQSGFSGDQKKEELLSFLNDLKESDSMIASS